MVGGHLRQRREDIRLLVKSIIGQLRPNDDIRISADALAEVAECAYSAYPLAPVN